MSLCQLLLRLSSLPRTGQDRPAFLPLLLQRALQEGGGSEETNLPSVQRWLRVSPLLTTHTQSQSLQNSRRCQNEGLDSAQGWLCSWGSVQHLSLRGSRVTWQHPELKPGNTQQWSSLRQDSLTLQPRR